MAFNMFKKRTSKEAVVYEATEEPAIGKDRIREAVQILEKYKQGKANLEQRIIENEQWWKMRHWEIFRGKPRIRSSLHPHGSLTL